MIQENKESRTAPRQSNTFKMLQEVLEADERGWKHTVLQKNVHSLKQKEVLFIMQYSIVLIVPQLFTHIFYCEVVIKLNDDNFSVSERDEHV